MKKELLAGVGRTEVTPELGVRLGGYGVEDRPAETINDPLHSTALYLNQGDLETLIINLDWIAIEDNELKLIRNAVKKLTGIPYDNITISTIHTHTAPNTLNFNGWGEIEAEYVNSVIPAIAESAKLAKDNAKPAKMGIAETRSETGVNRRSVMLTNGFGMAGDPFESFDPTMTVARFAEDDGTPITTLVHYGAHATAWGSPRVVSRDWPGVMKDRVESQTKAPVVFINGSIGNVGPRTNQMVELSDNATGFSAGTGDGLESVREVGYRAATDALRAYASIKTWNETPKLDVITEDVVFPYQQLPSMAEAKKELKKAEPLKDTWGRGMCEYMYWEDVINELEGGNVKTDTIFRQTLTRIGELALIPCPGELFAEISLRLRRFSPFQHTLCASVTNGSFAYLPAREARHRGGYEVWVGRGYGAYIVGEEIDDVIVEENLKLLEKLI
ncbi:MAG: neutral/alkaline non-lysosomal ceramidase N-terminal domain-containing protein [Victivallales bacterium]|nr:neutral/alkaline non-lysosomal ceramidase N-terminal domain-containing protein [Victivallales bacterium]